MKDDNARSQDEVLRQEHLFTRADHVDSARLFYVADTTKHRISALA